MASLHPCYLLWAPQSFHFPLFMTMLHLAVIFLFSALSRALVQCSSRRARVVLSWTDYLRRVAPTGRSRVRRAAREQRPLPCGHTLPAPSPLHPSPTAAPQQSRQCPCPCWLTRASAGSTRHRTGEPHPVAMLAWAKRFPRTSVEWAGLEEWMGTSGPGHVRSERELRMLLEAGVEGKGVSRLD